MKHIFVTSDGLELGHWKQAFGDARVVATLQQIHAGTESDCIVWALNQRLSVLSEWKLAAPHARLVVMSLTPARAEALQAFDLGARGYCHALAAASLLQDIAEVVSHGGLWIGSDLMSETLRAAQQLHTATSSQADGWDRLTEREQAVGRWIVQGASNREIAQALGVTERTVKAHLAAMFEKYQVRDRLQLALRIGPLDQP